MWWPLAARVLLGQVQLHLSTKCEWEHQLWLDRLGVGTDHRNVILDFVKAAQHHYYKLVSERNVTVEETSIQPLIMASRTLIFCLALLVRSTSYATSFA